MPIIQNNIKRSHDPPLHLGSKNGNASPYSSITASICGSKWLIFVPLLSFGWVNLFHPITNDPNSSLLIFTVCLNRLFTFQGSNSLSELNFSNYPTIHFSLANSVLRWNCTKAIACKDKRSESNHKNEQHWQHFIITKNNSKSECQGWYTSYIFKVQRPNFVELLSPSHLV